MNVRRLIKEGQSLLYDGPNKEYINYCDESFHYQNLVKYFAEVTE